MIDADRVRTAHGDAWAAEGRAREAVGGGVLRVPDARAMASGIPLPAWNNADITGPEPDLEQLRAWYERLGMPWGMRVPVELDLTVGQPLFVKRCFGATSATLPGPNGSEGLVIRRARPEELGRFVDAEVAMFGQPADVTRRFIEPVFGHDGFEHWFAFRDERTVAVATLVLSDGEAGRAAMLTGLAAMPDEASSRTVLAAAALTATLERDPDRLLHVHADPDDDPEELSGLGFQEVPGFVVRLVVESPT